MKKKRYKNLYSNEEGSLKTILKWQLGFIDEPFALFNRGDGQKIAHPDVMTPNIETLNAPESEQIQITWIGHATFLIQYGGMNILTDPQFSKRASPVSWFGPKRVVRPGVKLEELPSIDAVLISHNHYDHLDLPTVRTLGNSPRYFIPESLGFWFDKAGISNYEEHTWWNSGRLGEADITSVPVQHFSSRSLRDRNTTQWAGWVIELGGKKIFFAGDTGYDSRYFTDIYEKFGSMDLSLLPIGAYHPRVIMGTVHFDPREAVMAHKDLRSKHSIGMHWGTFRLTTEPMDEPPAYLAQSLAELGVPQEDFVVLKIGETRRIK